MTSVLMKDPRLVASFRLIETSAIVTILGVLGLLQAALSSPAGLKGFDYHSALNALAVGLLSGVVNGAIAYLNAVKKASDAQ